jgi:hypothetical protein
MIMGFKKCCVSNMTGTEGDVLWQEDHDKNCVSRSNDSDGTEWPSSDVLATVYSNYTPIF